MTHPLLYLNLTVTLDPKARGATMELIEGHSASFSLAKVQFLFYTLIVILLRSPISP